MNKWKEYKPMEHNILTGINNNLPNLWGVEGWGGGEEENGDHCEDDSVCYVLTWLYR